MEKKIIYQKNINHTIQQGLSKGNRQFMDNRSLNATHAMFKQSIQRRVADPTLLLYANQTTIDGAKIALINTVIDILENKNKEDEEFVTEILYLHLNKEERESEIKKLDTNNLIAKTYCLIASYPNQKIDSSKFDILPQKDTKEYKYTQELIEQTIKKMELVSKRSTLLNLVFGDENKLSEKSRWAGNRAKENIQSAITYLEKATNKIYLDTSGISNKIGLGGYAKFDNKIFLLVNEIKNKPSNKGIATLFHESMHLSNANIKDDVGYASCGLRFFEATPEDKLNNADHYAYVANMIDNGKDLSEQQNFIPRPKYKEGKAPNGNGVEIAKNVNSEIADLKRRFWSGSLDQFLEAVCIKKKDINDNNRKKILSENLNMTYHLAGIWQRPSFSEVDIALAEGTMNRIKMFKPNKHEDVDIMENYILKKDKKIVAFDLFVKDAQNSNILKSEDKTPNMKERIAKMIRPK